MRSAGSGTKAAFDETVMINSTETLLANATSVFSSSSSGVLTCLAANRRSIGYMDADQVVSFNAGGANAGLGYTVRLDGGLAHDPAIVGNAKRDRCASMLIAGWR
jgi:ABC-type phosphate transport system substrate-binding protein